MSSKRILIVDDEESILAVVRVSLKMTTTWDVCTATSGSEGIQIARAKQPDAILLDVMMPDMSGVETFQHLQADPQTASIPIIFLTARIRGGAANGIHDLNCAGAITKPFDALKLAERIAAILDWSL